MAKSAKRKNLSEEEKKQQNEEILSKYKKYAAPEENARRDHLVKTLSKENLLLYALIVLLPPVGVYMLWKKRENYDINVPTAAIWTFIAGYILVNYVILAAKAVI